MDKSQAVVIGGSIAGLLTARVLSDFFERVIVLDRDRLPVTAEPRRGVPQSVQPHVLLTQGYRIFEELLPGIGNDLEQSGAVSIDWGKEFHYFNRGHWNATTDDESGLVSCTCTRPLLESVIRQHISHIPNVELLENCRVTGLLGDRTTCHVTGVLFKRVGKQQTQSIPAHLTVDASGRGTQSPQWLKHLGLTPPASTRVDAGLGYATRRYRIPKGRQTPWKVLLISQDAPENRRLGYLAQVENAEWVATLGGYEHDYPPLENQGFLDFARSLANPEFYQAIQDAEPVSAIYAHRATANRLYHYERMNVPKGFIALGDAVCALCPVYGQGMTVSALSVKVLQRWLQSQPWGDRPLDTARFQALLAKSNAFPWSVATGQDSMFPTVQAQMPKPNLLSKLFQRYLTRLLNHSHHDADLHIRFTAMAHMVASPLSLLSPSIIWKAFAGHGESSSR